MLLFRNKKHLTVALIIVVLILGGICIGFLMTPKAPTARMNQAAFALSEAKKAQADIYSAKLFNESQNLYNSALLLWKAENDKFILNRNYAEVDSCIDQSIILSKAATNKSLLNSKNTEIAVLATINDLGNTIVKFEKIISELPLDTQIRHNFEKGCMLLSEARYTYKQGDYPSSKEKLIDAENHINKAITDVKNLLLSYFQLYPAWMKWYNETLTNSRNGQHNAIVIDKIAKKCYVYKNGKLKHTFDIELGKNWIGNKRFQGDKTTPEGIYKVTKKLDSKISKYHKALLINYPNDADKIRFSGEQKNGTLPRNASIGGLVEIHGEGGKGVNWTDGCIALQNNDMDIVFKIAEVNTTITIVGSLVDLGEIIDF